MSKRYWFSVKKFGLGWGTPRTWQGWATVVIYLFFIYLDITFLPQAPTLNSVILFTSGVVIASALLMWIAYARGERLQWRWGKKKHTHIHHHPQRHH